MTITNKKIFEMSDGELVDEYEEAVAECVKIQNFASKKSLPKAYQWEQGLKNEILMRLSVLRKQTKELKSK